MRTKAGSPRDHRQRDVVSELLIGLVARAELPQDHRGEHGTRRRLVPSEPSRLRWFGRCFTRNALDSFNTPILL
ncbi:hypothetical protein Rcae01_00442 [Novipirellula caenicola]|uniref:Uncharacterized protein n=1 Tax=Novipirellula caenicola TaxID=1536901 RepID=A0ABP9VIG8_9BACT